MRRWWLIFACLVLVGCSNSPTTTLDPQATQTRAVELDILTQVAGTVVAFANTPVAATRTVLPRATGSATSLTPFPAAPTLAAGLTTTPQSTRPSARTQPTKSGLPAFVDMVVDTPRQRLYGVDRLGGKFFAFALADLQLIGTVDLGQASQPLAMALSQDGAELAVALNGAGHIALIDPEKLAVTGKLYPSVSNGPNKPSNVRYAAPGFLYSVGNPGSAGNDYIHLFDTTIRAEIGISKHPEVVRNTAALALTADGALYIGVSEGSSSRIYRFALDGVLPKLVATAPPGATNAFDLAVRPDGSAVYTAGGQVWSSNLLSQLGAFTAKGSRIIYVAATERLFICQEAMIAEVEAMGNYNLITMHGVSATPRVARANAAGTFLYVSTDAGLDVVQLASTGR